ncbi:MAG: Hint domain-containing protein, partial [Pseudomonadota bacterium]
STNRGGDNFSLRVVERIGNDTDGYTGFRVAIDEYEYHNGAHPASEDINYLAIERGEHVLPDGRVIIADDATSVTDGGINVPFGTGTFDETPIVLSNVTGPSVTNGYGPANGQVVDSHPYSVTENGFTLEVDQSEEEAVGGRVITPVTVSYIAIEPGFADDTDPAASAQFEGGLDEDSGGDNNRYVLDDIFADPVVLAETQTEITDDNNGNDNNTATDTGQVLVEGVSVNGNGQNVVDLEFREERSEDSEQDATDATVGIVAFERGIILCFVKGTLILTPRGEVPVEDLCIGDLVLTKDDGPQVLRWIGGKALTENNLAEHPSLRPTVIRKDAFGPGKPNRDIAVSPQHRLLIKSADAEMLFATSEVFVAAKNLISAKTSAANEVQYYHLMFDQHQIVYANGLEAESLHPGHLAVDGLDAKSREELFAIFPELRAIPQSYGPACRPILKADEARYLAAPRAIH